MMSLFTCVLLFTATSEKEMFSAKVISERSLCPDGGGCVPLSQCSPQYSRNILYPCQAESDMFCCPSRGVTNSSNLRIRSRKLFPKDCGLAFIENKITGGEVADLGQFPWMALLGYKQKNINFIEYLCGGTIITENVILTAAHCLVDDKNRELVTVRVGEHNLQSEKDCIVSVGVEHCSESPVDLPVLQYIQHPNYNMKTLKNDIALVKVESPIEFTDYVQPICLPFEISSENRDFTGQKFTISGWGKTESRKVGGSSVLQFAHVRIWDQLDCDKVMPPEVRPITENQICANGKNEDACKGDSGGPLFNASLAEDGEVRNFQVGIVSFASTLFCGIEELPPIYTRVDKYLSWILDNVQ